jgi:hypothetical protein
LGGLAAKARHHLGLQGSRVEVLPQLACEGGCCGWAHPG